MIKYRFSIIRYFWTGRKIFNLLLNSVEYKLKRSHLISFPRSVNVELNNYCNLHCPSCPTHVHSSKRAKKTMTLREFNHVIKEVSNFVFNVALGGNGELTLIPKIDNYIASGYKNKLYVSADTNLNCSSGVVKRMFKAGIASVNISLDGTSQDSYGKYRIGGKFETVFNNMVLLASMKKKANSTLPYIQWQFIVNKYNEDEVEKAKVIAKETGVELRTSLPFIPGGDNYFFGDNPAVVKIIAKKFIPNNHRYRIMRRTDLLACYQPFSELQILSNGDIIPCCRLREKNVVMGNIFKQSLGEIWNNDLFRYFRKQLVKQGKRPHCLKCYHNMKEYYKKYNKNKYESYP